MKPKKLHVLVAWILFWGLSNFPVDSLAGGFSVFGPEVYTRGTGGPITVTDTFAVENPITSCTLMIHNGGLVNGEYERVSSSVISLNGSQVAGPNEFNQNVALIERPVSLSTNNQLSVQVRGKPGGGLTIEIVCPVMVTVPNLSGLFMDEAEALLEAAGLSVGSVSEEYRITISTGRVSGQSPPAGTEAEAGSAIDLVIVKEPPVDADEIIPDSWAGLWRMTITYVNASTHNIMSKSIVVDGICPEDPVGLALLDQVADGNPSIDYADCIGSASENNIDASCSGQIMVSICTVDVAAHFEMELNGDLLTGSGAWSISNVCGLPLPNNGQTFEISGFRLDTDPGPRCESPPSSLLQKFMRNPLFFLLRGEL